jgi:hypothetical protein
MELFSKVSLKNLNTIESWVVFANNPIDFIGALIRDVSLDCREANIVDPQYNIAFLFVRNM